ncbi:signal peptidase I [Halobaculum sp. EA56]|uniref:signal peptidase I n=1 Tax=Halobaculum sp. EA56 TaxID=3421648 RepID=UPI003EB8D24A
MKLKLLLSWSIQSLIVLVVVVMIAGQVLGQPVLLGFVETDSMEPTLNPGDGFIMIPSALSEPVEPGDVVVYRAEEIQGGGLTTHRVAGETDRGYITKGDANPFTDQDSGEPPVKDPQIIGKLWQINGEVVVIPQLGTLFTNVQNGVRTVQGLLAELLGTGAVVGAQGLAYLGFLGSLIWYVIGEWRSRTRKGRSRDGTRDTGLDSRLVVGVFAALLVLGATVGMIGPSGNEEIGVVSAEFESEQPTVIPAGESGTIEISLKNGGVIPVIVFLAPATEGLSAHPTQVHIPGGGQAEATVTLQAPEQIGHYRRFISQHRYFALLPLPIMRALYHFHPWAPIVAIDAMLGIPFYLLGIKLAGTGRVRTRSRDRETSIFDSVRRRLQNLYR